MYLVHYRHCFRDGSAVLVFSFATGEGVGPTPVSGFFRVLGFGVWVLGFGFWVSGFGFWVSGFGLLVSGSGFLVLGFGFGVSGSGFRVSGFGFRVPGFGFRVPGFGFRVSDFGFRVSGFGFRVLRLIYFSGAGCHHAVWHRLAGVIEDSRVMLDLRVRRHVPEPSSFHKSKFSES